MRHAYSLVELLVVIAIIIVLAAMLLPTLGMLRSRAEEVRCLSSLRQLYLAALGYAADNHDTLPMASMKTSQVPDVNGNYPTTDWYSSCNDYLGGIDSQVLSGGRLINPLTCPTFRKSGTAFGWMLWSSGYGINSHPWQGGDRSQDNHIIYSPGSMSDAAYEAAAYKRIRAPRQATISQESTRVYFGDCNDGLLEADGGQRDNDLAALPITTLFWKADPTRHRGSANYVFFDGHACRADRVAAFWGIVDPLHVP